MDFEIIDRAKEWSFVSQKFCSNDVWFILLSYEGILVYCHENALETFKGFYEKHKKFIEIRQSFEEDSFIYYPRDNSFVLKGILEH